MLFTLAAKFKVSYQRSNNKGNKDSKNNHINLTTTLAAKY